MSFMQEAIREWARNVGQDRPDQQWLLSDFDTWERNPFYTGPDQGHPEYPDMAEVQEPSIDEAYVCDNDFDDDIPF